ncbi:MAG TPA: dihydroxy-acid dehydratase [Spirillospora sp.]|mgnify:CR=1 FL=1
MAVVAGGAADGDRRIDEFEAAGGTRALLHRLAPLLETDRPTVAGRAIGDVLADYTPPESDVIRPLDDPLARHPGIVIVQGALAPDGAVVKRTVAGEGVRRFTGPAKVFRSREEGLAGIRGGEVEPGQVMVLTGLGLRGAPGMGFTPAFVFAIEGAGLGGRVAVVTDGQMSGLVNTGLVVAEVSPEGAVGGPIGLVRDGDVISIDVDARTIELDVPERELAGRYADLPAPSAPGRVRLAVGLRPHGQLAAQGSHPRRLSTPATAPASGWPGARP